MYISNFLCLYPCIFCGARVCWRVNNLESFSVHMCCTRTETDSYWKTYQENFLIFFLIDKWYFSIDNLINIREEKYNTTWTFKFDNFSEFQRVISDSPSLLHPRPPLWSIAYDNWYVTPPFITDDEKWQIHNIFCTQQLLTHSIKSI